MRKQLVKTLEEAMSKDERLALFLGDIGVYGLRKVLEDYPERAFNVGILEQATIGLAAGMALEGMIPIFHSIAPFVVERALEFLKIDFGYQELPGNLISVGASYDYASLGCTHHCPADVSLLMTIPNTQIVVPGTAQEFNYLFRCNYANENLTYFRLSEDMNLGTENICADKLCRVWGGEGMTSQKVTVIAVGPTLQHLIRATQSFKKYGGDITVLYCTTVQPFDYETLLVNCPSGKILLIEPYYEGALAYNIMKTFNRPIDLECVGVPHKFLTNYGTKEDHNNALDFEGRIIAALERMLND